MASNPPSDDRVVMGRIVAPYAIRGWIKIQPFTEYLDSLLDYDTWWLGHPGAWREFKMKDGKVHGQYLLAELDGVSDRNASEALQGLEVAVNRDEFPDTEADEYYWDDLIGLDVVNAEGMVLGQVKGLLETGAHDVLQVAGEGDLQRERLIPFVEAYVREVDKQGRCIRVDWGADWDKD